MGRGEIMTAYICKCCGAALEVKSGLTVCRCEFCNIMQTVPRLDFDEKAILWERADNLRRRGEYDRAEALYKEITALDADDSDIYWSIVLCRYGVEYVEEHTTGKRIPTINRIQYKPVTDDEDYRTAVRLADGDRRRLYIIQAKQLEKLRREVLAVSQTEQPYDIFICYKESDSAGRRTEDSLLAAQLYRSLTAEGWRVFYSRITLEDKAGAAYEPYIFAALNSAKMMIAVGTSPDNFNAVWVRNEWSRYLTRIAENGGGVLAVLYKGMLPSHLPEEFAHLHTFDMAAPDFMNELMRGVRKVLSEPAVQTVTAAETPSENSADVSTLLRRAELLLEDGELERADELCESVLNAEPENARGYLIKLLVQYKVYTIAGLRGVPENFAVSGNYRKTMRFADEALRTELGGIVYDRFIKVLANAQNGDQYIAAREAFKSLGGYRDSAALAAECDQKLTRLRAEERETARERSYDIALGQIDRGDYESLCDAKRRLNDLGDYRNSAELAQKCAGEIAKLDAQRELDRAAAAQIEERERIRRGRLRRFSRIAAVAALSFVIVAVAAAVIGHNASVSSRYKTAAALLADGSYDEAASAFTELGNYSDSAEMVSEARYRKAVQLFDSADFDGAEKIFSALGSYSDSGDFLNRSRYAIAESALNRGELDNAERVFVSLGTYSDSRSRLDDIRYQRAVMMFDNGQYEQAEALFVRLGDYSDSARRLVEVRIARAGEIADNKQYEEALEMLKTLKVNNAKAAELYADICVRYAKDIVENGGSWFTFDSLLEGMDPDTRKEMKYLKACSKLSSDGSDLALTIYMLEKERELYGYKDFDDRIKNAKYRLACGYLKDEPSRAEPLFKELGDYSDSAEKLVEARYLTAVGYYNDKKYKKAGDIFSSLNGYADSAYYLEKIEIMKIGDAEIGDTVIFGEFPPSLIEYSYTPMQLSWTVAERSGTRIMLACRQSVNIMTYESGSWADSDIRSWLNGRFYESCFTDIQKQMIVTVNVPNSTAHGGNTNDKVYIPSLDDIEKYPEIKEKYWGAIPDPVIGNPINYRWLRDLAADGSHNSLDWTGKPTAREGWRKSYVSPVIWIEVKE